MRSLARLSSGLALAGLLLVHSTCGKGSGDGLLSLRISADETDPPAAASKLLLTGTPGGISRTHTGPVQIVPGTPVLFQFPALPAGDSPITFSVGTYSADGCQVGRNAEPITATIKAGVETGPLDVTLVSAGPCQDAGPPDALTGAADVATSSSGGTGGFASTGRNISTDSGGGSGSGGAVTVPSGGAGGNASGGMTTTPGGGSGGNGTGGGTGSGSGGTASGGSGGLTMTAGGSTSTRTGGGGTVATAGTRSGSAGTVAPGGTSAGSGGTVATGGTRASSAGTVATGGTSAGSGGTVATGGTSAGSGGTVATGGSDTGGSGTGICPTTMPSSGTSHCSQNAQNTAAGLTWTLWTNTPSLSACITTFSTPAFSARWNNNGDFLVRYGLEFGNTGKPYDQYGTIKADFSFVKSGTAGGYSYIGAYGWSNNPCVEWYIIDDSYNSMPFTPYNSTPTGTATIDGEVYKLFRTAVNGSGVSRCGVSQYNQFWSVRQKARQCGTISITEHFAAWESAGSKLGNLMEVRILVETGGGAGSIDFPVANVTTSPNP